MRTLKKINYSWHRCRRSIKAKRDPDAFTKDQKNLSTMKTLEDAQKINLFYFDESGFTTASSVPYSWQPKGQTLEIPCFHSKFFRVKTIRP